jgi:uncharacterized protein
MMNELKVPVTKVGVSPYPVDVQAPAEELRVRGAKPMPLEAAGLTGRIEAVGDEYLVRGTVSGVYVATCDRCLAEMREAFEVEVAWLFYPGAPTYRTEHGDEIEAPPDPDEDPDVYPVEEGLIDLGRRIWEEASLAVPAKFICREDCAGLCPVCGGNLNETACACVDEARVAENKTKIKGLAGLAERFPKPADNGLEDSSGAGT